MLALSAVAVCGAGCAQSVRISQIPEDRSRLPERVRRIVVAPFQGDASWAPETARSMADAIRRSYPRLKGPAVISPDDLTDAKPPGTAGEAVTVGQTADADAVVYGRLTITVLRPNLPEPDPQREPGRAGRGDPDAGAVVSVRLEATLMDVGTREVYSRIDSSLSRRPDAAGPAGSPEAIPLERRPRRGTALSLSEVTADLVAQLGRRFVESFTGSPPPVSADLAGTDHVFGGEGRRFVSEGRLALGIETYRAALRFKPDDAPSLYNLGVLYEALDQPAEAMPYYEAALRQDPENKSYRAARDRIFPRVRGGPREGR
jgi:hypothetical protein